MPLLGGEHQDREALLTEGEGDECSQGALPATRWPIEQNTRGLGQLELVVPPVDAPNRTVSIQQVWQARGSWAAPRHSPVPRRAERLAVHRWSSEREGATGTAARAFWRPVRERASVAAGVDADERGHASRVPRPYRYGMD